MEDYLYYDDNKESTRNLKRCILHCEISPRCVRSYVFILFVRFVVIYNMCVIVKSLEDKIKLPNLSIFLFFYN